MKPLSLIRSIMLWIQDYYAARNTVDSLRHITLIQRWIQFYIHGTPNFFQFVKLFLSSSQQNYYFGTLVTARQTQLNLWDNRVMRTWKYSEKHSKRKAFVHCRSLQTYNYDMFSSEVRYAKSIGLHHPYGKPYRVMRSSKNHNIKRRVRTYSLDWWTGIRLPSLW